MLNNLFDKIGKLIDNIMSFLHRHDIEFFFLMFLLIAVGGGIW